MNIEIETLLKTPLDTDNGSQLARQISEIEAWGFYISMKYRGSQRVLSENRLQYYPASGTVEARNIELSARVGDLQETSDVLRDVQELIGRRVSLGQTLLKSMRIEAESGLR